MLGELLLCAYIRWLCMEGAFPTVRLLALVRIMAVQLCSSKYWTRRPFSSGCNDKAGNVAWITLLPVYEVG